MRTLPHLLFALIACSLAATSQLPGQELQTIVDSSYVVAGEQTNITVYVAAARSPKEVPSLTTSSENVTIRRSARGGGSQVSIVNGKRTAIHFYRFTAQSFKVGRHTIAPFELKLNGATIRSQPFELHVKPVDSISWQTAKIGNDTLRYGSAIYTPDRQPFVGETFPAEVKVYLPNNIRVAESGLAELEQNGVTAWRFASSENVGKASLPLGQYNTLTFRSTASAIREGECSLGPGKTRISIQASTRRGAFSMWNSVPVTLPLTEHKIIARPLPPGAPEGFDGAVGSFMIASSAEVENLEEGDPISVNITVAGTGNLDSLRAPDLDAEDGDWKTYEPSRLQRDGERREVTGRVRFSQIIRPLTAEKVIPPYQLAFFNPTTEQYQTVKTAPIPFEVIPSKAAVLTSPAIASAENAVRDMQGILGIVNPLRPQHEDPNLVRYWQIIPAAILTVLLILLAKRKLQRTERGPDNAQLVRQGLSQLEGAPADSREFLRAAGHFIEEWIPLEQRDEEVQGILARRDEECFCPESKSTELPAQERSKLLSTLRSKATAVLSLALLMLITPSLEAQEKEQIYQQAATAWEEQRYLSSIDLFRQAHPDGNLPADVDFNIGNCYYRLGEPGKAALHYHRALEKDPKHREAKLNLEYLESEQGTIAPYTPDNFLQNLVFFPSDTYQQLLLGCLWATAITILMLFLFRSLLVRVLSWITLPLALLGLIYSGTIYYGLIQKRTLIAFDELASADQLSVVSAKEAVAAHTEPHESAPTVIMAPPGVRCVRLAERGVWTYLEFADQSRGWMPTISISPLILAPLPDLASQTTENVD